MRTPSSSRPRTDSFSSPRAFHSSSESSGLHNMRPLSLLAACLFLPFPSYADDSNLTDPLSSHQILPDSFKPPEVFKHVNLVRNINLEKSYVREVINVVVENTDGSPQNEYYFPFHADIMGHVGGFEVRDKKEPSKPPFPAQVVEYDPYRSAPPFSNPLSGPNSEQPDPVLPRCLPLLTAAIHPNYPVDNLSHSLLPCRSSRSNRTK